MDVCALVVLGIVLGLVLGGGAVWLYSARSLRKADARLIAALDPIQRAIAELRLTQYQLVSQRTEQDALHARAGT